MKFFKHLSVSFQKLIKTTFFKNNSALLKFPSPTCMLAKFEYAFKYLGFISIAFSKYFFAALFFPFFIKTLAKFEYGSKLLGNFFIDSLNNNIALSKSFSCK